MKMAKVIPSLKTGNKHHFHNCRPVSPQFSKILERLSVVRLDKGIDKHKLLCDMGSEKAGPQHQH